MDGAGNLYGTTTGNAWLLGNCSYPNCGNVFKLTHRGSGWVSTPLYVFQAGTDGEMPLAGVIFGPDGALYGTTYAGGNVCSSGQLDGTCGTVFRLAPPASACLSALCQWSETVLYRFSGSDGALPEGNILFDGADNVFGTTVAGGNSCSGAVGGTCGAVFKLTPSNGGWTESTAYAFTGNSDGFNPTSGLLPDGRGNYYGTTSSGGPVQPGGNPSGTVFELTPSGAAWSKSILYTFELFNNGKEPNGLIFDGSGDLWGTTTEGGLYARGTAFELVPSNPGNWTFVQAYVFQGGALDGGSDAALVMDAAGNFYGTRAEGGPHGNGEVFKLTPSGSGWIYSSLHDFTSGSDGADPYGNLILDANGNLYGTAASGGTGSCFYGLGCGVVFEITP